MRMVPEGSEEEDENGRKEGEKKRKPGLKPPAHVARGPQQPHWTVCQVQKSKEEMAIISLQARRFRNQTEGSGRRAVCNL